tara:strand:+ start:75 stop:176 length:102 start_codon:yes stop_codon:yes gene_type:complete
MRRAAVVAVAALFAPPLAYSSGKVNFFADISVD